MSKWQFHVCGRVIRQTQQRAYSKASSLKNLSMNSLFFQSWNGDCSPCSVSLIYLTSSNPPPPYVICHHHYPSAPLSPTSNHHHSSITPLPLPTGSQSFLPGTSCDHCHHRQQQLHHGRESRERGAVKPV